MSVANGCNVNGRMGACRWRKRHSIPIASPPFPLRHCSAAPKQELEMKVANVTVFATIAVTLTGRSAVVAGSAIHVARDLHVEVPAASSLRGQPSSSDASTHADSLDDSVGASEDFWGSWDSHYAAPSDGQLAHHGSTSAIDTVVGAAAQELLHKAESVATVAVPFDVEAVGAVAAAVLAVVAVAAVAVGVRRQQLSEPGFGPVELASDLPEPMTTSSAKSAHSETGLIIGIDDEEKQEDEEGEEGAVAHV